jgi:hypothetical protein
MIVTQRTKAAPLQVAPRASTRRFAHSLDRSFRLLTSKKRSLHLANLQLLLHYSDSEVRC